MTEIGEFWRILHSFGPGAIPRNMSCKREELIRADRAIGSRWESRINVMTTGMSGLTDGSLPNGLKLRVDHGPGNR